MMTKILKSKAVCWLLILVTAFQSCTVYKQTPISISETSQINKRVMITTTSDRKIRLKRIEKSDSLYYGIKTVKNEEVKILLKENDIKKIRVKNQAASTFLTISAITITLGIIVVALLINDLNNSWGSFNGDGN